MWTQYYKNRLFTIGNGIDNYDRSDALVVYDDGRMQVKKSILCDTFTDGISYLSNGNLLGINTLESENIIDYKEALIFGFMGVLKIRNEINCLKSVTGASKNHSSGIIFE